MPRSLKKGPFIDSKLLNKVRSAKRLGATELSELCLEGQQ